MLTKKGKYGLKAMVHLAGLEPNTLAQVAEIAKTNSISKKFLDHILTELRHAGLVYSKKGKGGGYLLTRPPSTLTIGSLLRILEGPLAALPCASETAYRPCEECIDVESCGTRIILRQVRDATADILDRTTLADLLRRVQTARDGKKGEPIMYYI